MLKILQAKLQQYVNQVPDVQAGFKKGRQTRDSIANIHWIIEKAREFQKSIYFCFIDLAKAFDCVDHKKLENVSSHSHTKERQCQRMPKLPQIVLISHTSKVMLKILQARLQQNMNCELSDV